MNNPVQMEEEDLSGVALLKWDKKKLKKWRKKVERGEIQCTMSYLQSRFIYNLSAVPSISYACDKTRESCDFDMHLQELRELLLTATIHDHPLPRYFQIKNRAYIRYVLLVHINDLDNGEVLLKKFQPNQAIYTVKISKNPEEICWLPHKLLTLSLNECDDTEVNTIMQSLTTVPPSTSNSSYHNDNNSQSQQRVNDDEFRSQSSMFQHFLPYVMSFSLLKLWNYPLPYSEIADDHSRILSIPDNTILNTVEQSSLVTDGKETILTVESSLLTSSTAVHVEEIEEPALKRIRIDSVSALPQVSDDEWIGILSGTLPTRSELNTLRASSDFPKHERVGYYEDFPHNTCLITATNYYRTVSKHSRAYEALWSSSSSSSPASSDRLYHGQRCPLPIVIMDCEMCQTKQGQELTRVSLLTEDGLVLFDCLVKPIHPILNYHTKYSGMNETILQPVTITLPDLHPLLLRFIASETIVIGHSIENDLKALQICHTRCIDTTILYPHPSGYPLRMKLKQLAKDYLQLIIQQPPASQSNKSTSTSSQKIEGAMIQSSVVEEDENNKKPRKQKLFEAHRLLQEIRRLGHDSIEDATATLQLVIKKLEMGPLFGHNKQTLRYPITLRMTDHRVVSSLLWHQQQQQGTSGGGSSGGGGSVNLSIQQRNYWMESCVAGETRTWKQDSMDWLVQKTVSLLSTSHSTGSNNAHSTSSSTAPEKVAEQGAGKEYTREELEQGMDPIRFTVLSIPTMSTTPTISNGKDSKVEEVLRYLHTLTTSLTNNLPTTAATTTTAASASPDQSLRHHGLMIVTTQPNMQKIAQLQEKKRACLNNTMSTIMWSNELEIELRYEIRKAQLGKVMFHIL